VKPRPAAAPQRRTRVPVRVSRSPADTHRIAAGIIPCGRDSRDLYLLLEGGLGAGKTEFVKGVARALGFDPAAVHSPTFVLSAEYRRPGVVLHHADVYRCPSGVPADAVVRDVLEDAAADAAAGARTVACIEWADRLSAAARRAFVRRGVRCVLVKIRQDPADGARRIRVERLS